MEPKTPSHRNRKIVLVILVLIVVAGFVGWLLGNSNKNAGNTSSNSTTTNSSATTSTAEVKSLVSYTLPDGWKEGTCPNTANTVYVIPAGAELNCTASPSAPIKISIDPGSTTDCNQLANVQNVRKHVCISLYINGHKSLKASTEYPQSSSYPTDTTVSDYYINTGKGVVKVEYTFTSSNDYQMGFDQLATSVKVK